MSVARSWTCIGVVKIKITFKRTRTLIINSKRVQRITTNTAISVLLCTSLYQAHVLICTLWSMWSYGPGHAQYGNFDFLRWYFLSSNLLTNLNYVAIAVPGILKGSRNYINRSPNPGHAPLAQFFISGCYSHKANCTKKLQKSL